MSEEDMFYEPASVFNPTRHEPVPLSEWQQMEAQLAAANERIRELEVKHKMVAAWLEQAREQLTAERAISDKLEAAAKEAIRLNGVKWLAALDVALAEVAALRNKGDQRCDSF